jgi:hypothetical protein
MTSGRARLLPTLVVIAAAALGLSASTAAASAHAHRTDVSPCDKHGPGKSATDEGENGVLHCSPIWEAENDYAESQVGYDAIGKRVPEEARADDCARGTKIKGTGHPAGHPNLWHPHWYFTPAPGSGLVWEHELLSDMLELRDGRAVNIFPKFRNPTSGGGTTPNRYYFYCTPPQVR